MSHSDHWETHGLRRVFSGTIDAESLIDINLKLHGNPRFEHAEYVLNDFSEVDDFVFSLDDINEIAIFDKVATRSKHRLKIAIVSQHPELRMWAQQYCELMEGSAFQGKLFMEVEEAYLWVKDAV